MLFSDSSQYYVSFHWIVFFPSFPLSFLSFSQKEKTIFISPTSSKVFFSISSLKAGPQVGVCARSCEHMLHKMCIHSVDTDNRKKRGEEVLEANFAAHLSLLLPARWLPTYRKTSHKAKSTSLGGNKIALQQSRSAFHLFILCGSSERYLATTSV